jgi:cation diffusion facilitator CzcD-associated flavoprotein CzcO
MIFVSLLYTEDKTIQIKITIIGAGISGLITAIELERLGFSSYSY